MGIASKREATRRAPYNTALVERHGVWREQSATKGQSRHPIAVNARGSPSICASLIPFGMVDSSVSRVHESRHTGPASPSDVPKIKAALAEALAARALETYPWGGMEAFVCTACDK